MRRLTLILLANFVLLTLSLPPSANAQTPGSALNRWTRTGDLTAARSAACAAVLNDGRLLVAGGLGDSGSVAAVDIYGTDGAFIAGAPMTHARARAACVTLADGRVLVAGGNDGSSSLNSAEIFDPLTNQWQPTGNLSVAREGHQMAMTSWGFAWVAGGNSNGAITGTLELFNPDTGQFQAVGALNTARAEFAMTPVGRSLVIAGGTDGSNTLSSVEIYDGSLGTLTVAGEMSQARKDFAAAALLDGTILMTGGVDVNGAILSSTEIFDLVKGTSATGPGLLEPRAYHSAYAMAHNGSVLIYGGTGNSIVLGTTELYTPWTGSIAQGSALNNARRDDAKAALRAGSYMIAGGRNEAGFLNGSELFQFSTISTDKGDYAPGTAVKISGGGWVPGEQVLVTLTAFPIDQHHIEFTGAAVADGAGHISVPGFAVDESHLGMKFLMSAVGSQSQAQATFTDGIDPIISYTFNPPSGAAAPGTPVTVTVTLTPPSPANPTPTHTIIPCSPVLGCPTALTVSGASCDSTPICTLSPGAGNTAAVSFNISFPAGTTTFSIAYSGDSNYNFEVPTSGATPPGAPVVNYASQNFTVTDLTGGPVSPANFGTQTPYVANVCIAATSGGACLGSGTLSGKVQFFVNGVASGSPVSIVPTGSNTGKGTASFIPNPSLAVGGPYVITAMYGNDLSNAGSNSTAANGGAASISTTIIGKIDPIISYTFNPASGAAAPGTPVTVTVTLTPPSPASATPTGTIIPCSPVLACPTTLTVSGARCNSSPLCTLSPGAGNTATVSFNISFPAGTTTFSIAYSGDSNYNLEIPTSGATPPGAPVANYTAQTATGSVTAGSSLAVTVSANPAQVNQAITISINVLGTNGGPSSPTGTVTLSDNGVVIGVNPVLAAIATFSVTLGPGSHAITAVYSGDSIYPSSSASYGLTVVKPAPTVTFTASSSISVFGQPVTLSATLKGASGSPTPTGTVQFLANGVPLGSPVTIANGVATLTTSSLPAGANLIAVQYSGDGNFSSSTVNGGTVTVSQAQVTTTLAVTTSGAQMTLRATLAVVSPGSGTPTGTVRFIDTVTSAVLGTATVSGGSASVTIPVTSHPIVAVYSGDANFLTSTSASATAATITALNAASDVAAFSADAIISIYGSALTSQTVSGTLPLQSTLGGITVTVTDSAGVPRQALLFFVSSGQINMLIPAGTATGPATITVNTASGSLTTTINISASTAALFTANNNGSGPLAAQVVAVTAGGQQTYTDTAALSGTTFVNAPVSFSPATDTFYLLLYGTGFDTAKTVTVTINGKTFTPAYFGPQGGFAGLDQVNVLLPASIAGSGQVNVSITVDGQTSNVGTIAVGSAGTN